MHPNVKRAGLAALLLAGCALYFSREPAPPPTPVRESGSGLFAFVPSMEGTRPDGDLKTQAGEQLVVDAELGHLFDYYLAGLGEKGLDAIRTEIERELDRRLKPGPARQAKQLLSSYLAYKQALAGIESTLAPSGGVAQSARARLLAMRGLRSAYFTPGQSAGLFGATDMADDDAVARLRAGGAGDNEVYSLRAATFSPEAAARLADVDRDEAAWKARIGAYLTQRAALMAQPAQQKDAALRQLRDQSFSQEEQRRLGAYE